LIGTAVRKWSPEHKWLIPGIVVGSLLPDLDNLAVAVATVAKQPTEGLHRTFSHSLFAVLGVILVFNLIGWIVKQSQWGNLGIGLGIGILMHILFDILIWFDGVAILWPVSLWVNLWESFSPPDWFSKLLLPAEFLFLAVFFISLAGVARKRGTDQSYLKSLSVWTWVQVVLFVTFTALVYVMAKGFMTLYGAVYLVSLILAIGITIRMRGTLEAA
jgi:hypothetical protein